MEGQRPRALNWSRRIGDETDFCADALVPLGEVGWAEESASFRAATVFLPLAFALFFADLDGDDGADDVSWLG